MRTARFGCWIMLVAVFTLSAGCAQKFRFEKTDTATGDETKIYTVDGPKSDQKLKVEITADEPVAVLVHLEDNKADVKGKIDSTKDGNCEVNIPAGKNFVVAVSSGKKAKFTLKIGSN